jgi:hypothetical protein
MENIIKGNKQCYSVRYKRLCMNNTKFNTNLSILEETNTPPLDLRRCHIILKTGTSILML